MNFSELGLAEPLLRAVREQGYDTPTPIQAQAIPAVLKGGDLLVRLTGNTVTAVSVCTDIIEERTPQSESGTIARLGGGAASVIKTASKTGRGVDAWRKRGLANVMPRKVILG